MEKIFHSDSAYERWDRKNKSKGNGEYFNEEEREVSYLKGLKGRIQNNLSGVLRLLVTGLLVLIQFAIVLLLPFILQSVTVFFYFILELCSIVGIITLVNKNQSPSFRIAWISTIMILPVSGFVLYYLWGREGGKKKRMDQYILRQISYGQRYLLQEQEVYDSYIAENPVAGRMVKYMTNEGFPLTEGNEIEYYSMGEDAFEKIFPALEAAEDYILINFFIVAEGALWDKFYEILKRKVKQGVEVKFMYDDFGAAIRTRKFFREILEHDGIEVRIFNPIHKYTGELYMNYRSHQKIIVVDGKVGFTGGFNLADEYANLIERFGVWKDTGVRIKGPAVWALTVIFLQMWETCTNEKKHIDYLRYKAMPEYKGDTYCQVISDGPANNPNNPIESVYNQMIMFADQYLYITTPYLIIEDSMKQSLIEAAHRGVDVRIITPNIPDKKNVKLVTSYNYGELLRAGVRIYEYTPGFIHAKTILTEDCGIIGTINMDYRSFYLHYECGALIYNQEALEPVYKDLLATMELSHEISYEEWKHRPLWIKIKQNFLNLFATLM